MIQVTPTIISKKRKVGKSNDIISPMKAKFYLIYGNNQNQEKWLPLLEFVVTDWQIYSSGFKWQ